MQTGSNVSIVKDDEKDQEDNEDELTVQKTKIKKKKFSLGNCSGCRIHFETLSKKDLEIVMLVAEKKLAMNVVSPLKTSDVEKSDIFWESVTGATMSRPRMMPSGYQQQNWWVGMRPLSGKNAFARVLHRASLLYPDEFGDDDDDPLSGIPKTWLLPLQRDELLAYFSPATKTRNKKAKDQKASSRQNNNGTKQKENPGGKKQHNILIVKPNGGCGGEGMFLTSNPEVALERTKGQGEWVAQEYIANPLLFPKERLKFDFRLYVVVTSLLPLRYYVCEEGLVRFAVEPYPKDVSDKQTFRSLNAHLTNFCLNKNASTFVEANYAEDRESSKRMLSTVWKQLEEEFGEKKNEKQTFEKRNDDHDNDEDIDESSSPVVFNRDVVWNNITQLIGRALAALVPILLAESLSALPPEEHFRQQGGCGPVGFGTSSFFNQQKSKFSSSSSPSQCFQITGFDIMLDEFLKPYIIELNCHPSLYCPREGSAVDEMVKATVVEPVLRMACRRAQCLKKSIEQNKGGGEKKKKSVGGEATTATTTTKRLQQEFIHGDDIEEGEEVAERKIMQTGGYTCFGAKETSVWTQTTTLELGQALSVFLEATTPGSTAGSEMPLLTSAKFAKLIRNSGCCAATSRSSLSSSQENSENNVVASSSSSFSTASVDIFFVKYLRNVNNEGTSCQKGLNFEQFVDMCLTDFGDWVAPSTARNSALRLGTVCSLLLSSASSK